MVRDYDIAGISGACSSCGKVFSPGEEFIAYLFADTDRYTRKDLCTECSQRQEDTINKAFSYWRTKAPSKDDKNKRPRISTDVLIDFFEKTADDDAPDKINFRFVLALMLMRKKVLIYDRSDRDEAGREIWMMHFRADEGSTCRKAGRAVSLVRAELDEEQIACVAQRVGELFEMEQ